MLRTIGASVIGCGESQRATGSDPTDALEPTTQADAPKPGAPSTTSAATAASASTGTDVTRATPSSFANNRQLQRPAAIPIGTPTTTPMRTVVKAWQRTDHRICH